MRKQSDQSGFSLVQILMGVTIVSILSVGVMALLDNMNQQLTRTRTMGTRDALVRQVKDIIQTASSYSYTLGLQDKDNATFKLCMEGATPPANDLCIAKDPADQPLTYGVSFYGVGGTQAVSGGLGNPAKYNADGTKCDSQNQANCPLEVETWFQPICIVGKDCAKADDLLVFFSVKSAANAQYQVKTISNIGTPTAYSTLTRVVEPPPPDVLAGGGGGGGGGSLTCFNAAKINGLGMRQDVPLCCTVIGGGKVGCARAPR
ncbi:MAG: type II secretion system protein [Bdellovibrionales bacterium]|nr:type II secretion system protein [Bdellovibrionales bacterium]